MTNKRIVRKMTNDSWIDFEFKDLKKGDTFTLQEPDGTPVKTTAGNAILVAYSDAYQDSMGTWTIETDL